MEPLGPTLRRTRRRERPGLRAALAVALSLLVNALLVWQLDAGWLRMHRADVRRDVSVAPLTAADWEANRKVQPGQRPAPAQPAARPPPLAAAPKPAEPPRPPEPQQPPGQLVKLSEPTRPDQVKPEVPKDTKFVSDRDQTVEKQTKAKLSSVKDDDKPLIDQSPGAVATEAAPQKPPSTPAPGPKGTGKAEVARAETKPAPSTRPEARKAEDRPRTPGELASAAPVPPPDRAPAPAPGSQVGGGMGVVGQPGPDDPRLALPATTVAKVLGRSLGQGIDEVEEGDGTFLSTRSWKYATYFNRIRESVGNSWKPNREIQRRDPDGSLYFFKDRLTVLSVTLDEKGALKDVKVVRSSNVDFLDKVAVQAFEQAQPFTNPPAGLVNAQGEIKYVLGFEIYGARPGLHLFRGPAPQ